MRTATSTKSLQEYYTRGAQEAAKRKADEARMMEALYPLVDLWGEEKYNEWVDTWITDTMTIDEIIQVAKNFYPECTCTPDNMPCPGCREWGRARARLAGATEEDLDEQYIPFDMIP